MTSLSDYRAETILENSIAHALRREKQTREQAARLIVEADRVARQSAWLARVRVDLARDVFVTPDGTVARSAVVADGSTWPLLALWYETHPEERSNV